MYHEIRLDDVVDTPIKTNLARLIGDTVNISKSLDVSVYLGFEFPSVRYTVSQNNKNVLETSILAQAINKYNSL